MTDGTTDLTVHLNRAAGGDAAAAEHVWATVYAELRRIASRELGRHAPSRTLDTTGLVHETYLKFARQADLAWDSRRHFFGTACRAMRQVLVDHARQRQARKREAAQHAVTLDSRAAASPVRGDDLLALDDALTQLAAVNPRLAQVVECHFFGGLSLRETGEVLGTSERTAERDWRRAKAYLHRMLQPDDS